MFKVVLKFSVFFIAFTSFSAIAMAKSPTPSTSVPMMMLPDFTVLAEQNSPVVVNISTLKKVKASQMEEHFKGVPDEMLRYFFGLPKDFSYRGHGSKAKKPKKQVRSLGSGFIISEDGYIVTNNHVVEGADDIIVKLNDRKEYKAKIIGLDERTDIALIKIDANNLKVAKIGSSANLKVGQWVLAIGEPFGLDYTVTHGIVSAIRRSLPDDTYVPFIQTDVSINPGNSGGPLIDMKGEVVGVNSQIYSKSGGSMGLSFSIPIDIAMNVVNQLKASGKVVRGFLGVSVQEVSAELAKSFGLKTPRGALVAELVKGQSAEKNGILPGDIIINFNGKPINKSADLPPVVGATPIDEMVDVEILREGKNLTISLRLDALNSEELSLNPSSETLLGLQFESVSDKKLKSLNLPFGLKVVSVEKNGVAQKAGVTKGDILVSVNFRPVKSVKELKKIIKSLPQKRSFPIRVVRGKSSIFLPLSLKK